MRLRSSIIGNVTLWPSGLPSPRDHGVLVYLAVSDGRYNVELELPPVPGDDFPYQVAGQHSGLDFERLACVVGQHLDKS
jgi:hypothetical protein